jgi:RNA polymerase sigma-70 factor (ECF subfamily)
MKVSPGSSLLDDVGHTQAQRRQGWSAPAAAQAGVPLDQPLEFSEVYTTWFREVCRWIAALGGPEADVEDLSQDVFLIVRRKLAAFDGRNMAGWLFKISKSIVRDHRRRAWFKHLLTGLGPLTEDAVSAADGPATTLEKKEEQRTLYKLLAKMSQTRRETFVLFEIVGYSGEEIAKLQELPLNTVWTRLHHARKEFYAMVAALGTGTPGEGQA